MLFLVKMLELYLMIKNWLILGMRELNMLDTKK